MSWENGIQVCNHPQLFEEQIERVSLHFAAGIGALQPAPYLTMERLPELGAHSHLLVQVPRLIYRECLPGLPSSFTGRRSHPLPSSPSTYLLLA